MGTTNRLQQWEMDKDAREDARALTLTPAKETRKKSPPTLTETLALQVGNARQPELFEGHFQLNL